MNRSYKFSHVHIPIPYHTVEESLHHTNSLTYTFQSSVPNYPLDRFSAIDAQVGWAELTDPVNYKIGGHVDFIIIFFFFFNAFENNEGHGHRHDS